MAHHVFISYASKNKQLADALCHTLEQHRISCWIAPRDVLPGEPYAREIIRGIRDCQIIVLIYTNDSNASEHVLNEIDKAFNYGKVIIPFIADDTRMSDEFDYYLSRKHWLTAFPNPEQHFAKLVESIARTQSHTRQTELRQRRQLRRRTLRQQTRRAGHLHMERRRQIRRRFHR